MRLEFWVNDSYFYSREFELSSKVIVLYSGDSAIDCFIDPGGRVIAAPSLRHGAKFHMFSKTTLSIVEEMVEQAFRKKD